MKPLKQQPRATRPNSDCQFPSQQTTHREYRTLMTKRRAGFFPAVFDLFKQTTQEWIDDKAPQLGAALAYYTVFSLAPLILILLAIIGLIFRHDPAGAWNRIVEQMSYFLDRNAIQVVRDVAKNASHPSKGM